MCTTHAKEKQNTHGFTQRQMSSRRSKPGRNYSSVVPLSLRFWALSLLSGCPTSLTQSCGYNSTETGRALDSYASSLWARKGETGRAVRLVVRNSVICPESAPITIYHLTGHDLIAFRSQTTKCSHRSMCAHRSISSRLRAGLYTSGSNWLYRSRPPHSWKSEDASQ